MSTINAAAIADALDARVSRVFQNRYTAVPDMLSEFFDMSTPLGPQKDSVRFSEIGAFGDIPAYNPGANITYDDVSQGYLTTLTHKSYAAGFSVEVDAFEDELFGVIERLPAGFGDAAARTRQKLGAQLFNNGFGIDTTWQARDEGVALFSNSHTTTSGASTASGFDNLTTAALTAVGLQAAKLQHAYLLNDRAEAISVESDTLITPFDLEENAYEIIKSAGKVDDVVNNANVHQGRYRHVMWRHLNDVNNWFLADARMMKDSNKFIDRVKPSIQMVEEFDNFRAKWRIRFRLSLGWTDWRWGIGASVS